MILYLHLLGLIFNIWGALMLVVMVDKDLTFIIKNLSRVMVDDWEARMRKILQRKRVYLGLGIGLLIVGYLCEWEATIPWQ